MGRPLALQPCALRPDRYGWIRIGDYGIKVSQLLFGHPIAARRHARVEGRFDLFFCHHRFMKVHLRDRYATERSRHYLLNDELAAWQLPARVATHKKPIDKPAHWYRRGARVVTIGL